MEKKLFIEYARIKTQIKQLTEQAQILELDVMTEMDKEGFDKVESEVGTFFFTMRKKWVYPKSILKMEDEVKKAKNEAELSGKATSTETKSLSFRSREQNG